MPKKKPKIEILYSVDLSGNEYDGPCDPEFYTVHRESKRFIVRYYGICPVETTDTLEDAKAYIRMKAAHLINK